MLHRYMENKVQPFTSLLQGFIAMPRMQCRYRQRYCIVLIFACTVIHVKRCQLLHSEIDAYNQVQNIRITSKCSNNTSYVTIHLSIQLLANIDISAVNLQEFLIRLILAIKYFNRALIFKLILDFLFKSRQYVQKQLRIDYDEVYRSGFFHIFTILQSLPVNRLLLRSGQKWFIQFIC